MISQAIQQAIEQLIANHRSEFDVLVADTLEELEVEVDTKPISMDSIHRDNIELWRHIGDRIYPAEDPYEGHLYD